VTLDELGEGMWLRSNDDDQTPPPCPSLLYISPVTVSGWGCTTYTQLGKHFGSEETARCIQGRVSIHHFVQWARLKAYCCSIVGFLLGFSLASTYAAYRLVDEYKQASAILQTSVEELQATTAKVSGFSLSLVPISRRGVGFYPPEANRSRGKRPQGHDRGHCHQS